MSLGIFVSISGIGSLDIFMLELRLREIRDVHLDLGDVGGDVGGESSAGGDADCCCCC